MVSFPLTIQSDRHCSLHQFIQTNQRHEKSPRLSGVRRNGTCYSFPLPANILEQPRFPATAFREGGGGGNRPVATPYYVLDARSKTKPSSLCAKKERSRFWGRTIEEEKTYPCPCFLQSQHLLPYRFTVYIGYKATVCQRKLWTQK